MRLLQNLLVQQIQEGKDLSALPEDIMKELQKNIRDGAKDTNQLWANALELVHQAYLVAGVDRPTPDMREAWKQYEANIQYSVQQLSKTRGLNGDWRMSSRIFHEGLTEAMTKKYKFKVTENGDKFGDSHIVDAQNIDEVIKTIRQKNDDDAYDIHVKKNNDNKAEITFSKWGIKRNYTLRIERYSM